MINQDLGIATAYGYAKSKGYTGSEDDFATLMANYASVGTSAAASALKSEGFAVGEQNGTPVTSGSPYYQNNAKYYVEQIDGALALAYSSSATYEVGDYVMHSGGLYRCISAISTAEAWTAAHWTQVAMGDEVADLKTDLGETNEKDILLNPNKGYIKTDGTPATGSNLYYASINVLKGESYKICAVAGSSTLRLYVFVANGEVVELYQIESSGTVHNYDVTFTAPQDGTLYINTSLANRLGIRKVELEPKGYSDVKVLDDQSDDLVKYVEPTNLFNGEVLPGIRQGLNISTSSTYFYTKPILLDAGTYLFPSTSNTYGSSWCGAVDSDGTAMQTIPNTSVGQATETGYYTNRHILKFSIYAPTLVSFNVGKAEGQSAETVANFMIVKGETIDDWAKYSEYFEPYYALKSTVPLTAKMETQINGLSGLHGKTAIFDGDSICHGTSVGDVTEPTYGYGWAGRIGIANNMIWHNYGINGGVITSASNPSCTGLHSVVDNIDTLHTEYPNADFIVFEGGTNDADHLGDATEDPTVLGTFSPTDFSGTYDPTTFSGALDTIFYKATNYWKGKAIGFIVAQKMGTNHQANRKAFMDRAMDICEKWGIPYINLWDGCYLNPYNPNCWKSSNTAQENRDQGYLYTDGQHLTAKGYDYISPMIEDWMKSL